MWRTFPKIHALPILQKMQKRKKYHGQRTIFKYQRAETFYKQILDFYAENTTKVISGYSSNHQNTTEVISFGSFSGGTGCSTVAAAFCIYAVRRGARVLYLNLERFGTTDSFFHGEGQTDFGDVLYAVKSKRNNLNIKLESTLRQDASGVYFYASPKVALDLQEMDETDVKTLLDELCASGRYDCIITDIDLDLNPKVRKNIGNILPKLLICERRNGYFQYEIGTWAADNETVGAAEK